MSAVPAIHVFYRDLDRKWTVRPGGSTLTLAVFETLQEAIDAAWLLARQNAADLVVHSEDGTVEFKERQSAPPTESRK